MITANPRAPRFHAYFSYLENRHVFLMERQEWDRLRVHPEGEIVEIDISQTPIASVAIDNPLRATVAERRSYYETVIEIYREDPKDAPTPINVDRYLVWERLPSHLNYTQMVNTASTEDNANMRDFLEKYVFIVKEAHGPDHWQSDLPARIKARIRHRN